MPDSDKYFARHNDTTAERERLQYLITQYDQVTRRRFHTLPIDLRGTRILEVAGGSGSVATWLAEQVGPQGQVVATDVDTSHLEALGDVAIEVMKHDITTGPPEIGTFDIVHCRLLLMHLLDQTAPALEHMIEALRPGGWLLVEEPDFSSEQVLTVDHPGAPSIPKFNQAMQRALLEAGTMDTAFGRKLPDLVASLGLVDVDHAGHVTLERGGGPCGLQGIQACELMEKKLRGVSIDHETWNSAMAAWGDPSYHFVAPINYGVWGRKPG
jgi:SAM-dependent methyltransferase